VTSLIEELLGERETTAVERLGQTELSVLTEEREPRVDRADEEDGIRIALTDLGQGGAEVQLALTGEEVLEGDIRAMHLQGLPELLGGTTTEVVVHGHHGKLLDTLVRHDLGHRGSEGGVRRVV